MSKMMMVAALAAAVMGVAGAAQAAPFCPPWLPFCHLPPPPPPPHVVHTTPTLPQSGHNMSPLANAAVFGWMGVTAVSMGYVGWIGMTEHRQATTREAHTAFINILPGAGLLVGWHYDNMCKKGVKLYC